MHTHLLAAIAFAASFVPSAIAQNTCPQERATAVAANIAYGPAQNCPGIGYTLSNVQITFPANSCPMHLVYTPGHEIAQPSQNQTKVKLVGQEPITLVSFRCYRRYLLFIPLDSTCLVDRTVNLGNVMWLITVPCDTTPA